MPALKSALIALDAIDFPERQAAVSGLGQAIKKLTALHEESAAAHPAAEGGAPAGAGTGVFQRDQRPDRDARQAVVAGDQVGEARRCLHRPIDGAQAARLGGAKCRRRLLRHDLQCARRRAAAARRNAQIHRRHEQARHRVVGARGRRRRPAVAGSLHRSGRKGQAGIFRGRLRRIAAEDAQGVDRRPEGRRAARPTGPACRWASSRSLLGVAEAALDVAKDHAAAQRASAMRMLGLELALLVAALVARGRDDAAGVAAGDRAARPDAGRHDEARRRRLRRRGARARAQGRDRRHGERRGARSRSWPTRRRVTKPTRRRGASRARPQFMAKAAEERAKIAEEQAQAFRALGAGLDKLSSGDLTFRLSDGFSEDYRQIRDDFNNTIAQLQETIGVDRGLDPRGRQHRHRDLVEHDGPVAAHRGAGREPGADLGLDGGDLHDREEERGERPPGQPGHDRHARGRRSRRRGGGAGGRARWRGSRNPRARSPTSSA